MLSTKLNLVTWAPNTTRTPSTAFPNSRSRTPPHWATGIRADAPAYTPARGGLRGKACSTAFPGPPARAEPSRLYETYRRGPDTAQRLSEHLRATSGALGQSRTSLLRRAVRAVELSVEPSGVKLVRFESWVGALTLMAHRGSCSSSFALGLHVQR